MEKIKNNKGISLMSLIITILVIIILAAIVIVGGYTDNVKEAQVAKMLNEFDEVINAVSQRGYEHQLDPDVYPYENSRAFSEADSITIDDVIYGDGYYLVTSKELEKLGVTGTTRDFVVNYSTGEVVLKEVYYLDDKEVYTREDLLDIYTDNDLVTKGEYDKEKGVNRPILLDGMLPVKYVGSTWVVTSVDDPEWYDYAIDSAGGPVRYANVMLMDDTTVRDSSGAFISNEKMRGMNLENLVGCEVEVEGSMFVWLPRFTYKEEGGTSSVVYSRLTADYTLDGYIKHPAFYYGEYTGAEGVANENSGYIAGGVEVTGIWISKYEAGYTD